MFRKILSIIFILLVVLFGAKIHFGATSLFGDGSITLIGLALASVIAAIAAIFVTRQSAMLAPAEGRRLLDPMGWAAAAQPMVSSIGVLRDSH